MKNKIKILYKEKYIKVTDNWYPCYKGNKIKLSVSLNNFNGFYVKIIACGADDFILEIEKDVKDFKEAILIYQNFEAIYNNIPNDINKEYFYKIGFKNF